MLSLPLRLVVSVILAFALSSYLDLTVVGYFYSISVVLKDLLMLILPFVVFSYLSAAILSAQKQAINLVCGIFGLVVVANTINVFAAYGAAISFLGFLKPICLDGACASDKVIALWRIPLPYFLSSNTAMLLGLAVGIIGSLTQSSIISDVVSHIKIWATKALNLVFIPFLPLYVFGFVLKIACEGTLNALVAAYAPVFFLTLLTIKAYLLFWYFVGCNGSFKATFVAIRNMLPAWLTGFSTMSSAATLPITLKCVEKNVHNTNLTNFVVPATANIHMVGDGINITLTSFALLVMSGAPMPTFGAFLSYVVAYVITKFSGSGVPGGGMIILLPVVEQHLGLSSELCSLVATLYILQDSLMTASNIAGNGALALIAKKLFARKFCAAEEKLLEV